jgi:hypothetical protein
MTIEITEPETAALIERHLRSGRFQDFDELLKKALGSLDEQPTPAVATTDASPGEPNLFELFAPIRGLLTDDEIDTLFARNRSMSRPVDLS